MKTVEISKEHLKRVLGIATLVFIAGNVFATGFIMDNKSYFESLWLGFTVVFGIALLLGTLVSIVRFICWCFGDNS